jgi:hypothetical protein
MAGLSWASPNAHLQCYPCPPRPYPLKQGSPRTVLVVSLTQGGGLCLQPIHTTNQLVTCPPCLPSTNSSCLTSTHQPRWRNAQRSAWDCVRLAGRRSRQRQLRDSNGRLMRTQGIACGLWSWCRALRERSKGRCCTSRPSDALWGMAFTFSKAIKDYSIPSCNCLPNPLFRPDNSFFSFFC